MVHMILKLDNVSSLIPVLQTLSNKIHSPALVCCTYGKDRTGVVIALTLAVLGKSNDYIAEDYAKSAVGIVQIIIHKLSLIKFL